MITITISLLVMLMMTIYVIRLVHRYKKQLTCMTGMMIAMTNAMMSSILLGTIAGIFTNGQMLVPTVIAMALGILAGYLTGAPVSLMAAMDGMMSGIMGGMMGAMLGVMVTFQQPMLMIAFISLIYIVMMSLLVKMIVQETGASGKSDASSEAAQLAIQQRWRLFLPAVLLILAAAAFMEKGTPPLESVSASQDPFTHPSGLQRTVEAVQAGPYQEADITVEFAGYSADYIKLKAGQPAKLNFKKDYKGGCLTTLKIQDFDIKQGLKVGTTTIEFTPDKPGKYPFMCGMGMYGGYLIVE